MAGLEETLVCRGFVESDTFRLCREQIDQDARAFDERIEALQWALFRDAESESRAVPGKSIRVAVTEAQPHVLKLRVYFLPGDHNIWEILWAEEVDPGEGDY